MIPISRIRTTTIPGPLKLNPVLRTSRHCQNKGNGRIRTPTVFGGVSRKSKTKPFEKPPKTQVVAGNDLGWRDTVPGDGELHEQYLLRLVRTVRNNLFSRRQVPTSTRADG
ncbi:MAG: hypothetical protein DMG09_00220 [Acidobacteria bacterium]|nr:MAG: hypothetical protein DMG09_00220 [Acidobacteriota bacterium]